MFTYIYYCLPLYTRIYLRLHLITYVIPVYKCDPILENQPYRDIIDFEIWPCKVTTDVLGQKWIFALAWFYGQLPFIWYQSRA